MNKIMRIKDFIYVFKETYKKLFGDKALAKKQMKNIEYVLNIMRSDYASFKYIVENMKKICFSKTVPYSNIITMFNNVWQIWEYSCTCFRHANKNNNSIDCYDYITEAEQNTNSDGKYCFHGLGYEWSRIITDVEISFANCIHDFNKHDYASINERYMSLQGYMANIKSKLGFDYVSMLKKQDKEK